MDYFITFSEGVLTFISPCLLPMLPIYFTYLAGSLKDDDGGRVIRNSLGFVLGFSVVFILMGALASTFARFIIKNINAINIAGGIIIIFFGLNMLGLIKIPLLNQTKRLSYRVNALSFLSSVVFGVIFGVGWTPCTGIYLGSALILAASSDTILNGVLLLCAYSLGLGIPFVLSAVLLRRLDAAFAFIKKSYTVINIVSGVLLIALGIAMVTGKLNTLYGLLT